MVVVLSSFWPVWDLKTERCSITNSTANRWFRTAVIFVAILWIVSNRFAVILSIYRVPLGQGFAYRFGTVKRTSAVYLAIACFRVVVTSMV